MEELTLEDLLPLLDVPPGIERRKYFEWLGKMVHLGIFWARKSKMTRYVGAFESGALVAAAVLRKVGRRSEKDEVRDIYAQNEASLAGLIEELKALNPEIVEWRYMDALLDLGYAPAARSVLIGWRPSVEPRQGHEGLDFSFTDDQELAKEVQLSSWGFFARPRGQRILVGFLKGEPVCCAYLNPSTGNIDFGIHVKRKYWRMKIGTACLQRSVKYLRSLGFKWVYVVRRLRSLYSVNGSDRAALRFYLSNGGLVLRDYLLYREGRPRRPVPLSAYFDR